MAALHLTVGLIILLTTASACSVAEHEVQEATVGCLRLVVAGMAGYDMFVDMAPEGALEVVNAQLPIELDLTDRSAVETFLCNLAEVNGFSELSEFLGLAEPTLRRLYDMGMMHVSSLGVGEGEEAMRELKRISDMFSDVLDFADQVDFHPYVQRGPPRNPGGLVSSDEEREVIVDLAEATSFVNSMVTEHGDDFANDIFDLATRLAGGPHTADPVNVDLEDLVTAIVESRSVGEFAATIGVPERLVRTVFRGIASSQMNYPGSEMSMREVMEVYDNIFTVLLDLGFYSWE